MSSKTTLHQGYCIKSPSDRKSSARWKNRLCRLSMVKIPDLHEFNKKNTEYNEEAGKVLPHKDEHLVLSYYENESKADKDKPIKEFVLDGGKIQALPAGIKDYKFVIEVQCGALYKDREILLCFTEEADYKKWLEVVNDNKPRKDSLEEELNRPVQKFEFCENSLQDEVRNMKEEQKRRSLVLDEKRRSVLYDEKRRSMQVFMTDNMFLGE